MTKLTLSSTFQFVSLQPVATFQFFFFSISQILLIILASFSENTSKVRHICDIKHKNHENFEFFSSSDLLAEEHQFAAM